MPEQQSNVVVADFRRRLATPPPPAAIDLCPRCGLPFPHGCPWGEPDCAALYALPLLLGLAAGAAACYLAADLFDPRRRP